MPGRQLGELDQAVLRCLGIDEGDARAGVADARLLVEQRYPLGLQLGERLVDVLDLEADVVQPALAFRDHALVLAVGALAGDQLDHRLADVVERELAPVVLLLAAERNAEAAFPQLAARFGIADHHSNVLDTLHFHGEYPLWVMGYGLCVLRRGEGADAAGSATFHRLGDYALEGSAELLRRLERD